MKVYKFLLLLQIAFLCLGISKNTALAMTKHRSRYMNFLSRPTVSSDTVRVKDTLVLFVPEIASTPRDASGNFSVDIDQDFFVDWLKGKNFDRNYTQGTAFSYSKFDLDKSLLFFPMNLLDKIFYKKEDLQKFSDFPAAVAIGVTAFTPLDIADSLNPVIGDRPFANVVFLTTSKTRFNNQTRLLSTTSFSYGLIGSNIGNVFQSNAHTVITGRPTNIGWQYQISRGGKPAFLFSHSAMRSLFNLQIRSKDTLSHQRHLDPRTQQSADLAATEAEKLNRRSWLQASLGYRLNIGWYTGIAAVTSIRAGRFSRFSNSYGISNALNVANRAPNVGTTTVKRLSTKDTTVTVREEVRISKIATEYLASWHLDWYFFGTASPRLTPYNSLLLGQPGVSSVYTLPKENYNPFVLDFELGAFLTVFKSVPEMNFPLKNIDIILSFNGRTSEIISKDPTVMNEFKRTHYWGRVSIRLPLL